MTHTNAIEYSGIFCHVTVFTWQYAKFAAPCPGSGCGKHLRGALAGGKVQASTPAGKTVVNMQCEPFPEPSQVAIDNDVTRI